jgi:glycosyltransferase involved in cell wall biosynthesis
MRKDYPLVSIIVYNYNYGAFLDQCLTSIFNQTYENIEVLFSDNASTDDSWEIALRWQKKYPSKMFIARNRLNFGTDANLNNCAVNRRGRFHIVVGSDDVIDVNLVKTAVRLLEKHADAGYCMFHRNIIDQDGNLTVEAPFYNKNCIIKPPGQSLVYTVAAINPTITQILYRSAVSDQNSPPLGVYGAGNYVTRILDFNISINYPVIYLKVPLVNHRIHGNNQSLVASASMDEILGQIQLSYLFLSKLRNKNFDSKLIEEYENKINNQFGHLSMRYCKREILKKNEYLAKKYLHLSAAFLPEIVKSEEWNLFFSYFKDKKNTSKEVAKYLLNNNDYQRMSSYDPPKNLYKEIKLIGH